MVSARLVSSLLITVGTVRGLTLYRTIEGRYPTIEGQTPYNSPARQSLCTEWRECRQLALAAADRGDFETFHDLAWRSVQTGPPKDPALMYLLARAQALSGRPHDALVMLHRLAEMGVPLDAATNEDFARTRQLPGWAEVSAEIERTAHPESPSRPPAAVVPASVPKAPVPVAESRTSTRTAVAVAEAVRFPTGRFTVAGLAYDAVSRRFLFGDRLGRKVVIVGDGSDRAVDLVRAESAGFHDIAAIEIDTRRGDLWVASTAPAEGAGTLHRLQLVSGRPLAAVRVGADLEPVELVDLAVTPAGTVLVLDAKSRQLLALRPGGKSLDRIVRIASDDPTSVTSTDDETVAYVAHRDGVSRIDLRTRKASLITAPNGMPIARLEWIRWHHRALIAIGVDGDGSRRVARLDLNAAGRAVTRATTFDVSLPDSGHTAATISGDELVYVAAGPSSGAAAPAEIVAYRVRLR